MKELTVKQKSVLDFIINQMATDGFPPTVREIGQQFNITPKGAYDHMKAIEKKGYILCHKNRSRAIEILPKAGVFTNKFKADKTVMVPLVGTVAAGQPIFAEENIEDIIPFPASMAGNRQTFALKIKGDSMVEKGIFEGDLALISKTNTANNGDIVVALINDEATLKIFHKDHESIKLMPANSNYSPIEVKEVEILGKLTGILRHYN